MANSRYMKNLARLASCCLASNVLCSKATAVLHTVEEWL